MRRISHDLAGISQRINKLEDQIEVEVQVVSEVWRDDVASGFMQQFINDVSPQIRLLTSELATTIEEFESIARQLQDPDQQ